jgi:hypothetical protein
MGCLHDGFHAITTTYDRDRGVLVYLWICKGCGARLGEARRQEYRPSFDPRGNDHWLHSEAEGRPSAGLEDAQPVALGLPDAPVVQQQVDVAEDL